MPKYENVRIANFSHKKGKGSCYIAQGNKTKRFPCIGIISRPAKVESVGLAPTSGGIAFDPPVTCEINTEANPFSFLICKKEGK